jgi:hypothetical protein
MSVIVGWIVSAALNWLEGFFAAHIAAYEKDKANQAASKAQAAQDNAKAQTINEASKSDEIDSAGDDSSKHL